MRTAESKGNPDEENEEQQTDDHQREQQESLIARKCVSPGNHQEDGCNKHSDCNGRQPVAEQKIQ